MKRDTPKKIVPGTDCWNGLFSDTCYGIYAISSVLCIITPTPQYIC